MEYIFILHYMTFYYIIILPNNQPGLKTSSPCASDGAKLVDKLPKLSVIIGGRAWMTPRYILLHGYIHIYILSVPHK